MQTGRQIVLYGAGLLLTAAAFPAHAASDQLDSERLMARARPSVVILFASDANGLGVNIGTGFFVSSDGKLVTNHHVVGNARAVMAGTDKGAMHRALGVLAADEEADIVLLQTDARNVPWLRFAGPASCETGDPVAVIGTPSGREGTFSDGVVHSRRSLPGKGEWLQITAAVDQGSSGSPVLNARGEVVGVVTRMTGSGTSFNFAVPVEVPRGLLKGLKPGAKPQPFTVASKLSSDNRWMDSEFRAALQAIDDEDYKRASALLKSVSKRYPDNSLVHWHLGLSLENLKEYKSAITAYQQATKAKPDEVMAWYDLGDCLRKDGRVSEATSACRQATQLQPECGRAWHSLGKCLEKQGQNREARDAFDRADHPRDRNKSSRAKPKLEF